MEQWRKIKEFPGYEISNWGNVRNSKTKKILKQATDKNNYKFVNLKNINNKFICRRIHRLVAAEFLPNPKNLPEVDHINHKRFDNKVGNLCWISREDNLKNRLFYHPIIKSDLNNYFIKKYFNLTEAAVELAEEYNISYTAAECGISRGINLFNNKRSYKNYNWYFAEDYNWPIDFSDKAKADFWDEIENLKK